MRCPRLPHLASLAAALTALTASGTVHAGTIDVVIRGGDAIFLAGRTDVVIPPASAPWTSPPQGFLLRHPGPTPEEIQETFPPFILVTGGDVIRALNPALGGVSLFTGLGPPFFGPGGTGIAGSDLQPLGGISGYRGPQGPLTGVFLDSSIPASGPPTTLDFSPVGMGTAFSTLSPQLRQVFYIGEGVTSGGVLQTFIAPTGATRLFLGIPDGFAFVGAPGFYDDNDGSYQIRIGVNEIPTIDVPEPCGLTLAVIGVLGVVGATRYRWRGAGRAAPRRQSGIIPCPKATP